MEIHVVCIVILSAIVLSCHAQLTDEMKAHFKQQIAECKNTEDANDDDVTRFLAGDKPTTLKGKCLISCMQEAFGLTKGGQVQREGARKLGQMLFGNNDEVLSVLEIVRAECASLTDPDRCEASYKRMSCAKTVAEKHGLKTPREMI
ncbi:general odorant-binding protein 28a-like [Sitodiplosis mosellana]|uniref:general odorant-binding protein 28a-like n=1 Tax=Sitodiplosis mosellana TaxID=263140 RepID=UPI002443792A|nr:general odorant-binding protein 28a-like [Sitodiplosis mosellana]